jgi:hypothetical protein
MFFKIWFFKEKKTDNFWQSQKFKYSIGQNFWKYIDFINLSNFA